MPTTSDSILSQINCDIDCLKSLESFGKLEAGKKVGEATPDQAEFISLIVDEIKEDLMTE